MTIIQADILQWAATYTGPKFHALLCDPPYHLTEITRRFGKAGAAPAQFGTDGAYARASRGFMNATWDGVGPDGIGIAFRSETWAALGRLLHPGAFGMAFASTRGFHRMAGAVEDAGFIIHPMICWNFASGFPKATRIDVQVDRAAGAERETMPATELAQAWEGHRYGMQALKPAIEPIIVFQKPYQGKPVDSITRTGAGAINVNGGRIGTGGQTKWEEPRGGICPPDAAARADAIELEHGRWPANLVLSHTEHCNGECHPACPVRRLGEQSGESESKRGQRGTVEIFDELYKRAPSWHGGSTERGHDDSGTAARFFFNADYALERLEDTDPLIYVPKASTAEREAGLVDFDPTTVDDGRQTPIDNPYLRGETSRRNIHPTVKPIALARHLATLLLPPDLYAPRRILIPFAGVASEMIGAMLAGWEEVIGVELEADHVEIARARLAYWQQMKYKLMNPDAPVKVSIARGTPDGQIDMFAEEAA